MLDIKEVMKELTKQIVKGSKKIYSISQPVLYTDDDKYYISVFGFPYTTRDIQKGEVERPNIWAIADIETGKLIDKYNCREDRDFSDAKYEKKCSILTEKKLNTSKDYYNESYKMFDDIRKEIIENNVFDEEMYKKYLNRLLDNVSEDLERFYIDLSV